MRKAHVALLLIVPVIGGVRTGGHPLRSPRFNEATTRPITGAAPNGDPAAGVASPAPRQTLADLDPGTQHGILDAMRVAQPASGTSTLTFANPEQQLQAAVAAEGTTVTGRDGAAVTFSRPALGRTGSSAPLSAAEPTGVRTSRITIPRAADEVAVTEWWTNTPAGLEQGFTVHTRPAGTGRLEIAQTVTSDLTASLSADASGLVLSDASGVRLQFDHLRAWDRTGRDVPTRLELRRDTLAMMVDDTGARYPITIDPTWTQQAYLKASNTGIGDSFGYAVAVSGDTAVVGASDEDSAATGVNGNQADNSAPNAGAAYVFVRTGTTWTQQAYLKASNAGNGDVFNPDYFGRAVAVSGDTIVVGAEGEDSNATGVNGNQADNTAMDAGAAYVFVRTGTTWTQQAYLKASNTGSFDDFGRTVAVSGDTVLVAAESEESNATGVNGNQADNSAFQAGAAYVFVRTGTTWAQQAYLKASNTGASDFFGWPLALSGDTVVVGAFGEDSAATGVNGTQADNSASSAGAAYVFVRTGTTWTQQAYLKASNTESNDNFGVAVAVSGDTVVVGAYGEASNATGVNGNPADNSAQNAGAAYVFVRSGTTWTPQAYLKASNTGSNDLFGFAVAVSGDTVVVGAYEEDSNATGVNGNQLDNSATRAGAAYVFVRTGTTWTPQAYLKATNTGSGDVFGFQVAVSGDTVVVGALGEDSNATGVNGNQADNSAAQAGAVYVFRLVDPTIVDLNGDANGDAFIYNSASGQWAFEYTTAGGGFAGVNGAWAPGWTVAPARFNSDALTDVFLFNTSSGQWFKMLNDGAGGWTVDGFAAWGTNWQRFVVDLNGDGLSDLFLWDPALGTWFKCIASAGGFTYTQGFWSLGWEVYSVRLNNDTLADFFIFNRTNGQWFWVLGDPGSGFTYPQFAAWAPIWQFYPGDYNGDGLSDLLLTNPANGQFFVALNSTGNFTYVFGTFSTGWNFYPMDLDADGRTDLFLHNPSTGQWFEMMSSGAGTFTVGGNSAFGLGWNLYPTDFNGDSRGDLLLYNPTNGQWFQARNLVLGSFDFTSGTWSPGLTIVATMPSP